MNTLVICYTAQLTSHMSSSRTGTRFGTDFVHVIHLHLTVSTSCRNVSYTEQSQDVQKAQAW